MDSKKAFTEKLEAFFAGRGSYIVLVLCLTVLGLSAWAMLSGAQPATEPGGNESAAVAELLPETAVPVARPDRSPAVTEPPIPATPAPTEAPQPTAPAMEQPETPPEPVPAAAEGEPIYVWPVNGETARAWAMETLSFDPTMQDWRTHEGVDVAAPLGTQVRAAADGKVVRVYEDERLGTAVVIDHGHGITAMYANLAASPTVGEGERVSLGQVIGSVGATARSEVGEESHLHLAVWRNGESIDPAELLP